MDVWLLRKEKLSFSKPSRQVPKRFASANAEVLTTHVEALGHVLQSYNIDAQRLFNLDEKGMTSGRDSHGASKKKAIMITGERCHSICAKHVEGDLACVHQR